MSESQELYASVNYIKHKVDAIEKIEFLNLRSNKALQEEYVRSFCKGLFEKLNYEFSFLSDMSFAAAINEFKRKMENGVFKGFPKDKIDEDTLRGALVSPISRFCRRHSKPCKSGRYF